MFFLQRHHTSYERYNLAPIYSCVLPLRIPATPNRNTTLFASYLLDLGLLDILLSISNFYINYFLEHSFHQV
jgi:hypothetical protein